MPFPQDTEALAERLRACLQEDQELPRDWSSLFDDNLYKLHTDLVPEVGACLSPPPPPRLVGCRPIRMGAVQNKALEQI